MDEQSWIADGTTEVEPVTTETPVEQPTEVAEVEAAPTEIEVTEAVEAGAATAEEVAAFIEARRGDEPYQLPEDVLLPLKRGDKVEYKPVLDIMRSGMRQQDYDIKMREFNERNRAAEERESRRLADEARLAERAKYLEEQEAELRSAVTDPKKWAAYQEHLAQYQSNPVYRKNVDTALAARETQAENTALRSAEDERVKNEAVTYIRGWISELAEQYPGVDPDRVAKSYGTLLQAGQADISRSSLEQIYQSEADYLAQSVSPLQEQLADLTATVEALKASQAAEQHNETTAHALSRAKTPRVATGTGAPARTPTPAKKFGPNELQERNAEWVRAGS